MASNFPECIVGVIFKQWCIGFFWVLDMSKTARIQHRTTANLKLRYASHIQVSDRLSPPTEGHWANVWHAFPGDHYSSCLLKSKLPWLAINKTNKKKKSSYSLISFYVVMWETQRRYRTQMILVAETILIVCSFEIIYLSICWLPYCYRAGPSHSITQSLTGTQHKYEF